jgi:putative DNA primase/helicase
MIQIIGLRPYTDANGNEKKRHHFFMEWPDVPSLLNDPDKILDQIPKSEHWNLYFTPAHCKDPGPKKKNLRRFESQDVISFDIDGIDTSKTEQYLPVILKALSLDPSKTGIVFSGNGLQLHVLLAEPFDSPAYFKDNKEFYKSCCKTIDRVLKDAGLPGNGDSAVWEPSRLLRFPNTENRKPKGITQARVLNGDIAPQSFSLKKASGEPDIKPTHQLDWAQGAKVDHKAVMAGCGFIQWCFSNPEEVKEPHFYAALSLLVRMENGEARIAALAEAIRNSGSSSVVAQYSPSEVEQKTDQALKASGPRTCEGVDAIWGQCKTCPNFGKVTCPIQIKGKDFIATLDNGFHTPTKMANGHIKMVPCYPDLIKYFDSLYHHKTNEGNVVYAYKDHHYQMIGRPKLRQFALEELNLKPEQKGLKLPFAKESVRKEFVSLVESHTVVDRDFFLERGKLNFANGVLHFKDNVLKPHSPDYGFQYVLDYDYDPDAKCPEFDTFIEQVCCGDKEIEKVLLQYMGYALSGDRCWAQKCLLLLGDGANGKSTFINLLKLLAGHRNVSSLPITSMNSPTSVSLLEDKLFNISEEMPQGKVMDSSHMKNLISGGEVEARHLYKDPYFLENKAKLLFACNELPKVSDNTVGFFRRFIIIPFKATFDEAYDPSNNKFIANKTIVDSLMTERSGIMNRVIKAYQGLLKDQRFAQSEAQKHELSEYQLENDAIRYFLEESGRVVVHPLNGGEKFATVREIYNSYEICMEMECKERPVGIKKFNKRFRKMVAEGAQRYTDKKVDKKTQKVILDIEVQDIN